MSTEITPAIERAEEALVPLMEYPIGAELIRDALTAALDVEEMAEAMSRRPVGTRYLLPMYRELAQAVRDKILGTS